MSRQQKRSMHTFLREGWHCAYSMSDWDRTYFGDNLAVCSDTVDQELTHCCTWHADNIREFRTNQPDAAARVGQRKGVIRGMPTVSVLDRTTSKEFAEPGDPEWMARALRNRQILVERHGLPVDEANRIVSRRKYPVRGRRTHDKRYD